MNDDDAREKNDSSVISRRDLLRTAGAAGAAALVPHSIAAAAPAEAIEAEGLAERKKLFLQAQPDADFHVLSSIGHWVMYEAPTAVNALLLR